MCIDVSHLVLESLGDTGNHVLDDTLDSSESGNVLSVAMVESNVDDWLAGTLGEGDVDVLEVTDELAAGTGDGDDTGLDGDGDCRTRRRISRFDSFPSAPLSLICSPSESFQLIPPLPCRDIYRYLPPNSNDGDITYRPLGSSGTRSSKGTSFCRIGDVGR